MKCSSSCPPTCSGAQWPDHTLRKLFLNVDDAHLEEAQAFLDSYTETVNPGLPVVSRQSMASQYEAETRSSAVTGSAISIVIALVGILNFVNSMVTAIVSRRREFAVIQSIGMTKKQLRRMLVNEGLCYAVITLAASYLLGSLAVGIAYAPWWQEASPPSASPCCPSLSARPSSCCLRC